MPKGECFAVTIPDAAARDPYLRGLKQGWRAEGGTQVGFVGDEPFAKPLSVKWDLLFLIPIALTAALGVAGYGSMPDMLPCEWILPAPLPACSPNPLVWLHFP